MSLNKTSPPCHQGLTPPGSPIESTTPQPTVEDLKHLFENVMHDITHRETPNTLIFQEHSQPGPDMAQLRQLLVKVICNEYSSPRPSVTTKSDQSCSASNGQAEDVHVADHSGLQRPICTTQDDFKSFEQWAATPQFKIVMETWDKDECKYKIAAPVETSSDLDDCAEYVFVVRERVDRKSGDVIRYIDVKSELLSQVLRKVLRNVRAVSTAEDKPSIEQNVLFHFLPELNELIEEMRSSSDRDSVCLAQLQLLVNRVTKANATTSQRLASLLKESHITYDLLWALFKPGSHVYTTCFGTNKPRCVVFDAGEEVMHDGVTYYKLECRYLDYDGDKFGEAGVILGVMKFRGSKPVETLEAFPLRCHPNQDEVRKEFVRMGRKFCDLAGTHIQHCEGSAFIMKDGEPFKMNLDSRVAVDAAFFSEMQPNYSRPRLRDMWTNKSDGIAVFDIGSLLDSDRERKMEKVKNGMEMPEMTDNDFLISCPTVRCFSFKEKQFMECAVDDLRDADWHSESFDCLKIPQNDKQLLLSLATTRLGLVPSLPFDDLIEGKGRGLNVLLYGPPGVGKTFTVEATSERFKLPLYSISAGEILGGHDDLQVLERKLDHIFKVANHFNAVLLLDEADAFTERRTALHGAHNRLVTVFLRKLEYYEGILFLTSNRATEFDEAVLSRIHLKIKYEDLTKESRGEIWSHFLSKARTHHGSAYVEKHELQLLGSMALNGRDIKNLASIAHALATVDMCRVNYRYLEKAAEANEKFRAEFLQYGSAQAMYI